ncbi:MAG: hypothetical protein IKV30_06620 [Clostridia bacterium]|nr:hypothetical protein [Clostridia bacterium]
MKANKFAIALVVMGLSFAMLAACSGDKTTDATPDTTPTATPTATPNPLLTMDEVDRAILLAERYEAAEASSYKVGQDAKFVIEADGQKTTISNISQGIIYDNHGDNFVEYWVGETTAYDEKETIRHGYINGYEFYISDSGAKLKEKMSQDDYSAKLDEENQRLMEGLKICRENCSTITSYKNTSGNWVVEAKDYTVEASKKVFEYLYADLADRYGYSVATISVDYMIVMSEEGIPERTYIKVETTPYAEYDLKMSMTFDGTYTEINSVTEAPTIDLADAVEVPDIDIFEDISESISQIVNAESAVATIDSTVKVTGDVNYYYNEVDNISYSFKDDVYKLDIAISMMGGANANEVQKSTGSITYDGKTLVYNIAGQETSAETYTDAARALVSNMYAGILPTTANVSGYTMYESNGKKQLLFQGNQEVVDEALTTLYSLTGVKWVAKESTTTFMVEIDADGNVLYIKEYVKVSAALATYKTEILAINILDLTK